ncbi:hypothetical protein FN846DRAFT_939226 [Sphaerosporella brunnea]|uniref:Uncharacterized protein n=1 Tax=Sphaerosporella brunnea TaxID=1250544 RepID=A0A5J5F2Z6_9PEZI|nr:hypothetical protein FN846DRAFT_939226 [Sphaerosporella brunnea]
MSSHLEKVRDYVRENPVKSVVIAAGTTVAIAPAVLIVPVLGTLGFSAGGVVGGSIAAGVQSMIGNVAAGSLFAFCQSAAAGGYGAATIAAAGGSVAAATAAAAGLGSEGEASDGEDEGSDKDDEVRVERYIPAWGSRSYLSFDQS